MFQLVQRRRWYFLLSACIIIPGLLVMLYATIASASPFQLSIDFTGGSLWVLQFDRPVLPGALRATLTGEGFPNSDVTTVGNDRTLQVKLAPLDEHQRATLLKAIESEFGDNRVTTLEFSVVKAAIGSEVTRAAILAMAAASVAILGFMVLAFRKVQNPVRYGTVAIAAMLHDLLLTLGVFAVCSLLLGWQADALTLTALLTVVSFSMQDKIVVFDRIRENAPKYRGEPLSAIANRSVLETIHRSLATQLNAIFVMVAILLFGGPTIKQFIATMLVGLLSGTYSSIFIAVPLLVAWEERSLLGKRLPKAEVAGATANS